MTQATLEFDPKLIVSALVDRGGERFEYTERALGNAGFVVWLAIDGTPVSGGFELSMMNALGNHRMELRSGDCWLWFEAQVLVDRGGGIEVSFDEWRTRPAFLDREPADSHYLDPELYAASFYRPRPTDRVPVWMKELMASAGLWDLVADLATFSTELEPLSAPNFPSDPLVVAARERRAVERREVEAGGGEWRDLRLTGATRVEWAWPKTGRGVGVSVAGVRVLRRRWAALAKTCRSVEVLAEVPVAAQLAPAVRKAARVFPGVVVAGTVVGFVAQDEADPVGEGRGRFQPLWWDGRVGVVSLLGGDGSCGAVVGVRDQQMFSTEDVSALEFLSRFTGWAEQAVPRARVDAVEAVGDGEVWGVGSEGVPAAVDEAWAELLDNAVQEWLGAPRQTRA